MSTRTSGSADPRHVVVVGSMAVVQRYLEGSIPGLPTSVADVYQTMAVVDAAHTSADVEGIAPAYR